jgi:hypothetical protein
MVGSFLLKEAARECTRGITVVGEASPTGDLPTPDKLAGFGYVRTFA